MSDKRNIEALVSEYAREAERIAKAVAEREDENKDKAAILAEYAQQIAALLRSPETDAETRALIAHAIMFAVSMEDLTMGALWKKPVDKYIENTERIRKKVMLTADDLRDAEKKHSKRADQAAHLGISERHLRNLRNQMLD